MKRVSNINNIKRSKFEEYYNSYYSQIYRYILKKINNHSDAEDLTMDIFVACYNKFELFDESKASFSTWIYAIANNRLKNYYRDKKETDELDENIISQFVFEDDILTAEYIYEMRKELAIALKLLSEIQKTIIIHKFFNNKNASEIALIVGLAPGNVRVQLSRALNKLKEYFADNNIEWEN